MTKTYNFQYQIFPCLVEESADGQYLDFSSPHLSLRFSVPAAGLARNTATFVALSTAYYRGTADGFALAEAEAARR
ncbi:MAG: hypothetical protein E6Q97_27270 [Desulfurellales bacterium]|nr:MAG: hypothetical protein E6Q97_27270 [Desulfurellales bacterium]